MTATDNGSPPASGWAVFTLTVDQAGVSPVNDAPAGLTANSATVAADGTSYRILGLDADTAYDVRVTARVTIAGDTTDDATDGGSAEAQGTTWVGEPQECVCVRLDNPWVMLILLVID